MTNRAILTTRSVLSRGILAAGLLGAGAALAAPGEDRFPIAIADLEARQAARMQELDADANNKIDMAEFEAAKPRHHRGGRHQRDGTHHHHRGHHGARGHMEGREGMRDAVEAELFSLLDANEDGALSKQEHASATRETRMLARKRAMFKHLDADQDGTLSADELPNPAARLAAADSDGDGKITKAEMRAHHDAHRHTHGARQGD